MVNNELSNPKTVEADLKRKKIDSTILVTKAGFSIIPFIGGPVSTLLEAVMPSIQDRQNKWIISLSNDIQILSERINNYTEILSTNEMFITILMNASQIAVRNHQEEKLEALRNLVLNSTLNSFIEDDLQLIFLNFVDSFTVLHLTLLKFLSEPISEDRMTLLNLLKPEGIGSNYYNYDLGKALKTIFPYLEGKESIYKHVINDLESNGLISTKRFVLEISGNIITKPEIQPLGADFLKFISTPDYINKVYLI